MTSAKNVATDPPSDSIMFGVLCDIQRNIGLARVKAEGRRYQLHSENLQANFNDVKNGDKVAFTIDPEFSPTPSHPLRRVGKAVLVTSDPGSLPAGGDGFSVHKSRRARQRRKRTRRGGSPVPESADATSVFAPDDAIALLQGSVNKPAAVAKSPVRAAASPPRARTSGKVKASPSTQQSPPAPASPEDFPPLGSTVPSSVSSPEVTRRSRTGSVGATPPSPGSPLGPSVSAATEGAGPSGEPKARVAAEEGPEDVKQLQNLLRSYITRAREEEEEPEPSSLTDRDLARVAKAIIGVARSAEPVAGSPQGRPSPRLSDLGGEVHESRAARNAAPGAGAVGTPPGSNLASPTMLPRGSKELRFDDVVSADSSQGWSCDDDEDREARRERYGRQFFSAPTTPHGSFAARPRLSAWMSPQAMPYNLFGAEPWMLLPASRDGVEGHPEIPPWVSWPRDAPKKSSDELRSIPQVPLSERR